MATSVNSAIQSQSVGAAHYALRDLGSGLLSAVATFSIMLSGVFVDASRHRASLPLLVLFLLIHCLLCPRLFFPRESALYLAFVGLHDLHTPVDPGQSAGAEYFVSGRGFRAHRAVIWIAVRISRTSGGCAWRADWLLGRCGCIHVCRGFSVPVSGWVLLQRGRFDVSVWACTDTAIRLALRRASADAGQRPGRSRAHCRNDVHQDQSWCSPRRGCCDGDLPQGVDASGQKELLLSAAGADGDSCMR